MDESSFNYGMLLLLLVILAAVVWSNVWLRRRADREKSKEPAQRAPSPPGTDTDDT